VKFIQPVTTLEHRMVSNPLRRPDWQIRVSPAAWNSGKTESANLKPHCARHPRRNMSTRYRVIKVKGSEPEGFIVIGVDFGEHIIKSTSRTMTEDELRAHLHEAGATDDQIKAWIQQGRNYPG
jgi:hypothetical protein